MDTLTESPSTSELFDTSPKQEEKSSPVAEVKEEKEEKATVEESEEKSEVKESDSKDESEEKEKTDEPKEETSSDTEDKPSTEESTVGTQLKDARKWGNENNRENIRLRQELKQIKEENGIEDIEPDDSDVAARLNERVKTSESIERDRHGDEFIDKTIYGEDSIWQQVKDDPIVDFRVRNADSPISEALKVVKEQVFYDKYGNDPDKIVPAIKEELRAELMKELKTDFKKKLKDKESLGSDLSDVESDKVTENKSYKAPSTEELFG